MSRTEEIKKYISDREGKDKGKIIEGLMKEFDLSLNSAKTYYSRWKVEYMNTKDCIPKEKKAPTPVVTVTPKEKITINTESKKVVTSDKEVIEQSETPKEDKYINKDLKVLKMTVKGKYGTYEKEGTKVKVGDLEFKNEQDIDNYKQREMTRFLAELGEILDVMLMEV